MMWIKADKNEIENIVKNALNRTLTRARKEQREFIFKKHGVKKKYLNTRRLKGYRARNGSLEIRLTSTSKFITPFMQISSKRPKVDALFGTQKNRDGGGKFYVSSKNHSVNGYIIGRGKLREKDYYYIKKRANLDDELLEFKDELNKKAVKILDEEISKG